MRRPLVVTSILALLVVVVVVGRGQHSDAQEPPATPGGPELGREPTLTPLEHCLSLGFATPAPATPSAALPTTVTVELYDIGYRPCAFAIPADTPVTLELTNTGTAVHNLVIDELGINVHTQPGETKTVAIDAPPGVYTFYSDIPGHREAGQVGVLTVVAIGTPAATPAASPPTS